MVLGLSIPAFTLVHVIISLIAIGAGIVALLGMANNQRLPGWNALFLLTTLATSVTGFLFPFKAFGPPHAFGVITIVVMIPVLLGIYIYSLRGRWRLTYIIGAAFILYLNAVVAVIQFFQKFAFLRPLAPTQSEPPFLIAQAAVLGFIVLLTIIAAVRFRPALAAA